MIGAQACAGCHAAELDAWKSSHHALAMRPTHPTTVLGDFFRVQFEHLGATTGFFRDDDKSMTRTDSPDGAPHAYQMAYAFGVNPLHSLGLLPVCQHVTAERWICFQAHELAPESARYAYVYAVALNAHGDATALLEKTYHSIRRILTLFWPRRDRA